MANREGYCEHGVYVGGCGIDWMCHYCESGVTAEELAARDAEEAARVASLPKCEKCGDAIDQTDRERIAAWSRIAAPWALTADGDPRWCLWDFPGTSPAARSAHTAT